MHEIVVKFDTVTSKQMWQHIHKKIEKSKLEAYVLSRFNTWVGSLSNVMSRLNYYVEGERERRKLNVSVASYPVAFAMHYTPALKK